MKFRWINNAGYQEWTVLRDNKGGVYVIELIEGDYGIGYDLYVTRIDKNNLSKSYKLNDISREEANKLIRTCDWDSDDEDNLACFIKERLY